MFTSGSLCYKHKHTQIHFITHVSLATSASFENHEKNTKIINTYTKILVTTSS